VPLGEIEGPVVERGGAENEAAATSAVLGQSISPATWRAPKKSSATRSGQRRSRPGAERRQVVVVIAVAEPYSRQLVHRAIGRSRML